MNLHRILRIGHRGGAGIAAPENTLGAIEIGLSKQVDLVEVDVQLTRDKRLVIMHDKRVDRTTNGSGLLKELDFADIRNLDAGAHERVPSLEEVLAVTAGCAGVVLEIITPRIGLLLYDAVKASGFSGPVIFSSFLHSEIRAIRAVDASADTLALLEGVPVSGVQFALDVGATHVGLGFDSVTPEFVREVLKSGLGAFMYTVNHSADIAMARDMGASALFSDYPELI